MSHAVPNVRLLFSLVTVYLLEITESQLVPVNVSSGSNTNGRLPTPNNPQLSTVDSLISTVDTTSLTTDPSTPIQLHPFTTDPAITRPTPTGKSFRNDSHNEEQGHPNFMTPFPFRDVRMPPCDNYFCERDKFYGCSCDELCFDFGDCCYNIVAKVFCASSEDIFASIQDTIRDDNIERFPDYPINRWSCVSDSYAPGAYWMVNSCPNDTQNELCNKSKQYDKDNIPVEVFIDDEHMVTFQNIFCALCNGFNSSDVMPWDIQVFACNISEPVTELTSVETITSACQIRVVSENPFDVLPCDSNIDTFVRCPSSDNETSQEVLMLCKSYLLPVRYVDDDSEMNTVFKNPHCAYCELGAVNDTMLVCEDRISLKHPDTIIRPQIDIRLMLDLTGSSGKIRLNCNAKSCGKKEVYDCLKKRCRPIVCLNGIVTADGTCSPYIFDSDVTFYKPFDFGIDSGRVYVRLCPEETNMLPEPELMDLVEDVIKENDNLTYMESSPSSDSNCLMYTLMTDNKSKLSVFVAQLLQRIIGNDRISETHRINVTTYNDIEELSCKNRFDELLIDSSTFQKGFDEMVTISGENQSVSMNEGHWSLIILGDSFMFEEFATCKRSMNLTDLTCPSLEFSEDEIVIENGTARIINSTLEFKADDFQIVNGKIYICAHSFVSVASFLMLYDYPEDFGTISIVSSALTVASVVIIIGMHCIFKRLRNVYGLNITALSLVLLFMHLSLLFQNILIVNKESCTAFAATLHFIFISMFMWLTIIGFDMATMLRHHVVVAAQNSVSVFKKYVLVGLAVPFAITGTGLILDVFHSSFRPGYGENNRCWIAKETGIVAFVTVPVSLSLAMNVLLFVTSIVTIQKTKMSKTVRHTRGQTQYLTVYVKLLIILGFTWAVGLLSGFIKSDGLWMLHMVLNGLQGVSLLICFITNARIIRLVTKDVSKTSSGIKTNGRTFSDAATEN